MIINEAYLDLIEFDRGVIRIYSDPLGSEELVSWTEEEWKEDPAAVFSIAYTVALAASGNVEEIKRLLEKG